MFFQKKKLCDTQASGCVGNFPPSLVNPLYKPKTLGELKALMVHTGINPAPIPLRDGVPEIDGVDPMDTPPVPVTGDTFEAIRAGQYYESRLADLEKKQDSGLSPEPVPESVPEPAAK